MINHVERDPAIDAYVDAMLERERARLAPPRELKAIELFWDLWAPLGLTAAVCGGLFLIRWLR